MNILIALNLLYVVCVPLAWLIVSSSKNSEWSRVFWLTYGIQCAIALGWATYLNWRVRKLILLESEPPIRRSTGQTIE